MASPLGYYIDATSLYDGKPLSIVLTGFRDKSENSKTGAMIQSWIMRPDVAPHRAVVSGQDISFCGNCPRRPIHHIGRDILPSELHPCYVLAFKAPLQVWKCLKAGRYQKVVVDLNITSDFSPLIGPSLSPLLSDLSGRKLRIGSWGDPGLVDPDIWDVLVGFGDLKGWTGYTRRWADPRIQTLKELTMASVDTLADYAMAKELGWQTFRACKPGAKRQRSEKHCPASKELGKRTTCYACNGCSGTMAKRPSDRLVFEHGLYARKGK
jgi:hypothetical protein